MKNDEITFDRILSLGNTQVLQLLKESRKNKSHLVSLPTFQAELLLKALTLRVLEIDEPVLNAICAKLGLLGIRRYEIPRYVAKQQLKQSENKEIDDAIEVDLTYIIKHLEKLADGEKKKGNTYIQQKIMECAVNLQHLLLSACVIKEEVICPKEN